MRVCIDMFQHEYEALLEAIRRDLRIEKWKAICDAANREFHLHNARDALRLLDLLNPRQPYRHQYVKSKRAA